VTAGAGATRRRTVRARRAVAAALAGMVGAVGGLAACTADQPNPTPSPASGSSTVAAQPTPVSSPSEVPEPSSTNTLPPPPPATAAAPSTSGRLTARSLPVPEGWRTVVREGGPEEGYEGNGTWVHGRDPRYAAHDVMAVGCAPVSRDDYEDPEAALEGTYEDRRGRPGVGLVLEFASPARAADFFTLYGQQVRACVERNEPVRITIEPSDSGLIDRRRYPDGEWTEVAQVKGRRVTMVILSDPGHRMSRESTLRLLRRLS
jgi:hypothetical protein